MTWLLKIKRRAQNAAVAWLDWPGETAAGKQPWRSAEPVSLPGDEGWADDTDHQAWLRSMQDPQTPDEIRRAHIGAERLRAAMHEQSLVEADAFLHEMTDGGGER